jgi:hypothetical protein
MLEAKKKRGPAKGSGGRPVGTTKPLTASELLQKAQVLREHLERPAAPTHPQWGSVYELHNGPLSKQLPNPQRLARWWRRERVQLTNEEIEICWRWLLPQ